MQQKERNHNWTKEEDEALCKARLCVSEDPATGTNQQRARLWDRLRDEFNDILAHQIDRISSALMNRFLAFAANETNSSFFALHYNRAEKWSVDHHQRSFPRWRNSKM